VLIGLGGVRLSGAVRRREKGIVVKSSASRAEKRADQEAAKRRELEREAAQEPRVTAGFPAYRAEPVVEPVVPVTRPVNPAGPVSPASAVPGRPAHAVADEAGLTESERAARVAARDEARNAAADAPGAPRPPAHG
jgi:hypothetical protein